MARLTPADCPAVASGTVLRIRVRTDHGHATLLQARVPFRCFCNHVRMVRDGCARCSPCHHCVQLRLSITGHGSRGTARSPFPPASGSRCGIQRTAPTRPQPVVGANTKQAG